MDEETLITGIAAGLDVPTSMVLAEDEQPQKSGCLAVVLIALVLAVAATAV
jgi:hypothetical protein